MPSSSLLRSFTLLLAAGAVSQQYVDAAICAGTEDAENASMSCGGLVNSCTSSGMCVVGTDGKCCSVYTDSKDNAGCVQKVLEGFPYTAECPMEGYGITGTEDDGDMVGITAFCSGTEDKTNFADSCGGLVDSCTGEGLCVVSQDGMCCAAYIDAEKATDCIAKGEYANASTCNKGDVGILKDSTGSPVASPVAAATGAPTKMPTKSPTTPVESGCSRKDATGLVLGSVIALVLTTVVY